MAISYAQRQDPTKKLVGAAAVAALHVVLVAGFVTALHYRAAPIAPPRSDVRVLPVDKPQPVEERKIKPVDKVDQNFDKLVIPPPDFTVDTDRGRAVIIATTGDLPPRSDTQPVQHELHAAIINAKSCATPDYPSLPRRLGQEGTTTLSMLIGVDGRVRDAKVEGSSGSASLDRAALSALSLCRFTPATSDGKPVEGWNPIKYVWRLN